MEPTNDERAMHAEAGLEAYLDASGGPRESMEETIGDLITDLLHMARREGVDTALVLRAAERDFAAESPGFMPAPRPPGSPPLWRVTVVRKLSRRMSVNERAEIAVEAETALEAEQRVRDVIDDPDGDNDEPSDERFDDLFDEIDADNVAQEVISGPTVGGFPWEDTKIGTVRLPDDHPVYLPLHVEDDDDGDPE